MVWVVTSEQPVSLYVYNRKSWLFLCTERANSIMSNDRTLKRAGKAQRQITQRRRKIVLELKKAGLTYREIAEQVEKKYKEREDLDYDELPDSWDHRSACQDISRELDKYKKEVFDSLQEHVMIEVERIEEMVKGLWKRVRQTNSSRAELQAIDRILKLMDRKAKYLGLDSPEQLELMDRTGDDIEEFGWASPEDAPDTDNNDNIVHGD